MKQSISRRTMLRSTGVAIALPALDCMTPVFGKPTESTQPRRMVAINFELSFHPPNLMPEKPGRDYKTTRYLQPLAHFLGLVEIDAGGAGRE